MDQMSNYGEDPLDGGNEDECVDVDDALSVLSDTPPSVTWYVYSRRLSTTVCNVLMFLNFSSFTFSYRSLKSEGSFWN